MVMVFDSHWLTPLPVEALRKNDGADVLLLFPVEPSLKGEDGLLRINVLLRQVVQPSGRLPSELDRRFVLKPGHLDASEQEERVSQAITDADRQEQEWLNWAGPRLISHARHHSCSLKKEEPNYIRERSAAI